MKPLNVVRALVVVLLLIAIAFKCPVRAGYSLAPTLQNATASLQDTIQIELEKTKFDAIPIVFIHDTAATTEQIGSVFSKNYGELMQFARAHNITPIKFMGWYYTMQAPWVMDIAVETNRVAEKTAGRVQAKVIVGGDVLVAHVWGPYNQIGQAYRKIQMWLQQNGRRSRENPFEVYINDPATVISPSDIQTDIYQPLE